MNDVTEFKEFVLLKLSGEFGSDLLIQVDADNEAFIDDSELDKLIDALIEFRDQDVDDQPTTA